MSKNIQDLTEESLNESLKINNLTLIDVWAPWCGPCKQLTPIIEQVNSEMSDKVFIGKLNADDNMEFCKTHNVRNIPTILLFKDGQVVDRMSGLKSKKEIIEFINSKF
jgi:thioredoxin 1